MQFTEGATVVTASGEKVGTIDRVVLDPGSKEVSHLVVKKGFLFSEDKVVPMSLVGPASAEKVILRESAGDLEALPDFEEAHYVATGPQHDTVPGSVHWARPLYVYPPVGAALVAARNTDQLEPHYVSKTKQNIPEGTIALEEGAKVFSSDGEHIGDIERIFTEPQENQATHLLISEGLILKDRKLIPTRWMRRVLEDRVHLSVDSDLVASLPEYQVHH
jgi:uncharacterized protein YrrD